MPEAAETAAAGPPRQTLSPASPQAAALWSEATNRPFLFAGAWWMRDDDGRIGRWDQSRDRWVESPPDEVPFFMRRPRFSSLKLPMVCLMVLLSAFLVLTVITTVGSAAMIGTLDGLASGEPFSLREWNESVRFFAWRLYMFCSFILIMPFFIWWSCRAAGNAAALGAEEPSFSWESAVNWSLLPLANGVQMLRILNLAWKMSEPGLPLREHRDWRAVRVPALLPLWWLTFVAASVGWLVALFSWDPGSAAASLRDLTVLIFLFQVALAAVTVVTIGVVASLTWRQETANARFDLPAGLAHVPGERAEIAAALPPSETLTSV